jgi:putative glutathione S-transferase
MYFQTQKIVNNESSEIMRMLNNEFNRYAKYPNIDLYPLSLRSQIDSLNDELFAKLNSAVYRAGFAKTQQIYDQVYNNIFEILDKLEGILTKQRYLINNENLTECDVRAWTTLIRFDIVYFTHFKCNKKLISKDYPNLFGFIRELYQTSNISETVDFDEIKKHYFVSHVHINPTRIIPNGPEIDFNQNHQRDTQKYEQSKKA